MPQLFLRVYTELDNGEVATLQLLFSSGPKLLKDSDPDRGGCWVLVRKVRA